jgi:dynein assembly factor 1
LRCLYLHQNCIEKMENLSHLEYLDNLNLSENFIKKIEEIKHLKRLTSLTLSNNSLQSIDDIIELAECDSIVILDLSRNKLDDPEILTQVFNKMPNLKVLKLEGNPVIRKIPNYRKTCISTLKFLTYLDSMPVFEDERRLAEAWQRGGLEEEKREREMIKKQARKKEKSNFKAFEKLIKEAKEKRLADISF